MAWRLHVAIARPPQETTCKDLYKELITCSLSVDWSNNAWNTTATAGNSTMGNCIDMRENGLKKCKVRGRR